MTKKKLQIRNSTIDCSHSLGNPTESRKIQLVQILHKLPITGKRINTNSTA